MNRAAELLIAFMLGGLTMFLLLYAMAEPLQAPTKRTVRIET